LPATVFEGSSNTLLSVAGSSTLAPTSSTLLLVILASSVGAVGAGLLLLRFLCSANIYAPSPAMMARRHTTTTAAMMESWDAPEPDESRDWPLSMAGDDEFVGDDGIKFPVAVAAVECKS
jgi:hypothetical protein